MGALRWALGLGAVAALALCGCEPEMMVGPTIGCRDPTTGNIVLCPGTVAIDAGGGVAQRRGLTDAELDRAGGRPGVSGGYGGPVYVRGYQRRDGTYVRGYTRRR
jgi:hypothetical protein